MAEEDLIFAKNRHMFGGIEPSNMLGFEIASRTNVMKILALLPEDTTIDGQTLCTVAGAVIRRRTDKYPVDEFDGDLIADIKESGLVADTSANLSATYYYAAFPYTTQGVYNRCSENRVKFIPSETYFFYGFDLDTENPDPDKRVSYPSEVLNTNFAPATSTGDDTFNYGGWPSTPGEGFMPRPCHLNRDGSVAYYLNPDDYSKKADGTDREAEDDIVLIPYPAANPAFTVTRDDRDMLEWPKIYTKRELVDGIYKFRCASKKIDDSYECWCNYDLNNNEIDHFYTAIHNPTIGYHDYMYDYVSGARTIGPDWNIEVLSDRLLIQDLLVMMSRTTDCVPVFGGGKVFGMINYFGGEYGRELAGWINDKGTQKIKITQGTKDGSTATDYNDTGDGYLTAIDTVTSGYISKCKVESYGRIPIEFSGSKSTYECSYVDTNTATTEGITIAGINYTSYGNETGLFGFELGGLNRWVTASLSCKPRKSTS